MKNKKIVIPIVIVLIVLVVGMILFLSKDSSDNSKFNDEFGVKVPKGTEIVYLTVDSLKSALVSNDKLVFLGNKSSKDTNTAVKTLLKVAEDNGIDKIYYYDTDGLDEKEEIFNELTKFLDKKEIVSPTLFLIKDKKAEEVFDGLDKSLEEKYEEIMIAYIMCNTPNC